MTSRSDVSFVARLLGIGAFLLLATPGCGDRRSDFLGARVEDRCDESWPICDTVAGCILGHESYRSGRFPGHGRFIVRLAEPSLVRVSFFLENVGASGERTIITWHEEACRARIREEVSGRTFVGEAQRYESVSREAELDGVGDHLIEFESDAQAEYLVKVDVTPRRTANRD